ncbi:MAG: ABC transporter ATP-binding protein [Desulfobacterales bacterium]|nr:ABC transporter ATP-binding protein [Desulfobacterales bacterium]
MTEPAPVLEIRSLEVIYEAGRRRRIQAVSDASFEMIQGETLGLVGESGCGKSSIARAVMQLPPPTSGRVMFFGEDLTRVDRLRLRQLRPRLQMIFQDSVAALNPRRKVGETIAMPLRVAGKVPKEKRNKRAREMMSAVGLDPALFGHRPFQLSGGQCQRVQFARALMTEPGLLICDEPVSSLDVSIQAQILNLLERVRIRHGLTILFISHDMAVVKNVCDRVAVMYLGKLCETAPTEALYRQPAHPYTAVLINAIPMPGAPLSRPEMRAAAADLPSSIDPPSGCRFHTRCPVARARCAEIEPSLETVGPCRQAACHYPLCNG